MSFLDWHVDKILRDTDINASSNSGLMQLMKKKTESRKGTRFFALR